MTITKTMIINIQPIGSRLLVKPIEDDKQAKSSLIVIPDTIGKETPTKGTVIALGDGKFPFKVNDKVLYSKYGGTELKENDIVYKILNLDDVIALLHE